MKKPNYSESQIFQVLKEAEAGVPALNLSSKQGMSSTLDFPTNFGVVVREPQFGTLEWTLIPFAAIGSKRQKMMVVSTMSRQAQQET